MDLSKCLNILIILYITPHIVGNNIEQYIKSCLHFQEFWNNRQALGHPLSLNSLRSPSKEPCRSYKCLIQSDTLELDKLKHFKCVDDYQCFPETSGMICSNHSQTSRSGDKYCSCPSGYAYSTNECRCKPAELCWSNQVSSQKTFL